ncbi:MAG: carboxypeptidase regulatory-like domain-containing protein, partial [Acidobacteria bacterium]|nr:carboxypeptidase regulatory-like domain-containing protein [Acidobacteriota bacterium]
MKRFILALVASLVWATAADAQQTTGTVIGRVLDDQGAAIPGATITVTSPSTGFTRSDVSDAEGVYRLRALPVGNFDIAVELAGFASVDRKGVVVNVGQTITLDFTLKVAALAETVIVTGQTPLIEATVSSVGG